MTHFELGDRVGISWLHTTCGACEFCVTGWETLCPHQKNCGYSVAGTMSEYSTVDAAYAVRIPQSLSSEQAARKHHPFHSFHQCLTLAINQ